MPKDLTPEEISVLIRARRLLKEKGLAPDTDVKTLCEKAGISRKTGYQWEKRMRDSSKDNQLREAFDRLKTEHEKLKKDYDDVCWKHEGLNIAWEIHEVDALLAEKKITIAKGKKKKR